VPPQFETVFGTDVEMMRHPFSWRRKERRELVHRLEGFTLRNALVSVMEIAQRCQGGHDIRKCLIAGNHDIDIEDRLRQQIRYRGVPK
jgi:hypothetical protein